MDQPAEDVSVDEKLVSQTSSLPCALRPLYFNKVLTTQLAESRPCILTFHSLEVHAGLRNKQTNKFNLVIITAFFLLLLLSFLHLLPCGVNHAQCARGPEPLRRSLCISACAMVDTATDTERRALSVTAKGLIPNEGTVTPRVRVFTVVLCGNSKPGLVA